MKLSNKHGDPQTDILHAIDKLRGNKTIAYKINFDKLGGYGMAEKTIEELLEKLSNDKEWILNDEVRKKTVAQLKRQIIEL